MADTTFVDGSTVIIDDWCNDVNIATYRAIGAGGAAPATPADVRTNLGLPAVGGASLIGFTPVGNISATTVQTALAEEISDLASNSGSSLVGFIQSGTGATARTAEAKLQDAISVKDFGAVGDGVTSDQSAIVAAVARAKLIGAQLLWPVGTYLSTANIPDFHSVRHAGPGVVKRGANLWAVTPSRTTTRVLYVAPTGSALNDGLSASQPLTIQGAVTALHTYGAVVGRTQIVGTSGVYAESVIIPDGLAQQDYYLEFKFPSAPGVRGDPSAWPAGGAILDGTGIASDGFDVGKYNKVYIEYLLVRNWYDGGLPAASQVRSGISVGAYSYLYAYGVSGIGNGWNNIYVQPRGYVVVTGGIQDGARYGINVTGGRLSMTASVSTYTTVRNALEYGLYAKHEASAVLNYTEFLDCGKIPAASTYGSALFAYKSNASIDTLGCVFKRNNIAYHMRGGFISTSPDVPDTIGTGADANTRVWNAKGAGADDLIHTYKSLMAREISQAFGGGTFSGATTTLVYNTSTAIKAGYLTAQDQLIEIQIFASNNAGGTAQIRPSLVTGGGTRYELGNFQIAASTGAFLKLLVYVSSGGTVATVLYDNNGASISGATTGQVIVNPIVFDSQDLTVQIWGETSSTNTLTVRKVRTLLWG